MSTESPNDTAEQERASVSIATIVGLILALSSPLIQGFLTTALRDSFERNIADMLGLSVMWVIMFIVLALAYFGDGIPLSEFGFRRYRKHRRFFIREFVYAVLIGAIILLTIFPLSVYVRELITGEPAQLTGDLNSLPHPIVFVFMWMTGSFTEEVLFRSYPIERITAVTGKAWLAGLITAFLFTVQHLGGWDWIHVLTIVLPGAIILTLVYLWRRSLFFNVLIHATVNSQFLIIAMVLPFLR